MTPWGNKPEPIPFTRECFLAAMETCKANALKPSRLVYSLLIVHPLYYEAEILFHRYLRKGKITLDWFGENRTAYRLWKWCMQKGQRKQEKRMKAC